jgi:hypothetical protein
MPQRRSAFGDEHGQPRDLKWRAVGGVSFGIGLTGDGSSFPDGGQQAVLCEVKGLPYLDCPLVQAVAQPTVHSTNLEADDFEPSWLTNGVRHRHEVVPHWVVYIAKQRINQTHSRISVGSGDVHGQHTDIIDQRGPRRATAATACCKSINQGEMYGSSSVSTRSVRHSLTVITFSGSSDPRSCAGGARGPPTTKPASTKASGPSTEPSLTARRR